MNDEDLKESIWNEKHQLKMISDYGLQLIIDKVRNHDKIQVNNMLKTLEGQLSVVNEVNTELNIIGMTGSIAWKAQMLRLKNNEH